VPSISSGSVIAGRGDRSEIVCISAPGMANWIWSVAPALALASSTACRSDPGPLSFALPTRKICGTGPPLSTVNVSPVAV
jgi:hypothetical protein